MDRQAKKNKNMAESGSQTRVGTRSIGVETSGGFCYEDDSDSYLDFTDLWKNGINLNRSGSFYKLINSDFHVGLHSFVGSGIDLWNSQSVTIWDYIPLSPIIKLIINFIKS